MGDIKGFMKYPRQDFKKEPADARLKHWKEFTKFLPDEELKKQGGHCMDCGVPFCQSGCPIGNIKQKDGKIYTYGEGPTGPHAVTSLSDGTTFTYDANGNMATKQEGSAITYDTYDTENHLTQVKNGSTTIAIYATTATAAVPRKSPALSQLNSSVHCMKWIALATRNMSI